MKILELTPKKAYFKVLVENSDDLWCLSQVVEENDLVGMLTERKIKLGEEDDRKAKVIVKKVFLLIEVEKVEFSAFQNWLRISGKVHEGKEDIPKGSHHTFNVVEGEKLEVEKKELFGYQIDKLKESEESKGLKIIICLLDRENVLFARLKKYNYELLSEMQGEVEKKNVEIRKTGDFYKDIARYLEEYEKREGLDYIILGSPAFFKDEFMKIVPSALKKKIVTATVSSVGKSGVNELLKRPEVKNVLKQSRIMIEMNWIEDLLAEISKGEMAVYGIEEIKKANSLGAIKEMYVSDALIIKMREKNNFKVLENEMKTCEKNSGKVHVVSSEHDGGKKLDGLGGIAGLLRFRIN